MRINVRAYICSGTAALDHYKFKYRLYVLRLIIYQEFIDHNYWRKNSKNQDDR